MRSVNAIMDFLIVDDGICIPQAQKPLLCPAPADDARRESLRKFGASRWRLEATV